MSNSQKYVRLAVILFVCLLLPACKNKVTKENFDKITVGMSLAEVEKILGKGSKEEGDGSNVAGQFGVAVMPQQTTGNIETYKWESGNKTITIYFSKDQGKVVKKVPGGF